MVTSLSSLNLLHSRSKRLVAQNKKRCDGFACLLFPSHVITIQQKKHRSVFRCHCYNCCTTKVIQENVFLNVKASSVAASNNSVHGVYLVYSDYYISTYCRRCQQNFQQFSKNLRFFANSAHFLPLCLQKARGCRWTSPNLLLLEFVKQSLNLVKACLCNVLYFVGNLVKGWLFLWLGWLLRLAFRLLWCRLWWWSLV